MRRAWRPWGCAPPYSAPFPGRLPIAAGSYPRRDPVADRVSDVARAGDHVLDVGSGAGDRLVALTQVLTSPFFYTGVDIDRRRVEQARRAFDRLPGVGFRQADVHALSDPDAAYELVVCGQLLAHLPSIAWPLSELCRVARRHLLIRTPVASRSVVVRRPLAGHRGSGPTAPTAHPQGEASRDCNVHSETYLRQLLSRQGRVRAVHIAPDPAAAPDGLPWTFVDVVF